jgi:hypothetical protein
MSDDGKEVTNVPEEGEQAPLRIDEVSQENARARPPVSTDGGEEDDETWTNQPAKGRSEPSDVEDDTDDDALDHEEVEEARAPRRAIQNGRDVITEELPERAQRAALRLKPFLTGVMVIELTNSGERFLFDWRDEGPKTSVLSKDIALTWNEHAGPSVQSDKVNADAVVSLSENHIMSIRSGDLNPQIGMLTEKIRVKGKIAPAVYLFNLIAPRSRP